MKLNFIAFQLEIKMLPREYYVEIWESPTDFNNRDVEKITFFYTHTMLGAYLRGWEVARWWAKKDKVSMRFIIFKHSGCYEYICCRDIEVEYQIKVSNWPK